MRDDPWLQARLDSIWNWYFADVERKNTVTARFKGHWKNKFGHIKRLRNKDSEIAINNYFRHDHIPEFIIELTLAHELVHYMHGFNSPHPKLYKYPHAGGVVNRELKKRGMKEHLKLERAWIKNDWERIIKTEFHHPTPVRRRWW